jgi:hypothetical protein
MTNEATEMQEIAKRIAADFCALNNFATSDGAHDKGAAIREVAKVVELIAGLERMKNGEARR